MSKGTKIQWTEETWNPTAGCSKVSPGCKNCYAIKDAIRLSGNNNPKISEKYAGTTSGNNWSGHINLASNDTLLKPYFWSRSRRIFVNSMSDLFHENIPFEWIDKVFSIMALSPQHTFQILTKRAERMRDYFASFNKSSAIARGMVCSEWLQNVLNVEAVDKVIKANFSKGLPNVWLGVSVENQKSADERIPLLLETPATVRWLSCEPLLEKINLTFVENDGYKLNCLTGRQTDMGRPCEDASSKIDWVVVGGESGTNARDCRVSWIQSIVRQCQSADVPVFVKQLGSKAYQNDLICSGYLPLKNKKGGDISEFPQDLQVREFPK